MTPNSPPQDSPSQEITFDPFAKISAEPPSPDQQQTEATVPPTSPDFNEFSPQPMIAPVPRPTPKGVVPQALPPPPTKQSVKAANRKKLSSGSLPLVQSPTSVTSPPSLPSPSNGNLLLIYLLFNGVGNRLSVPCRCIHVHLQHWCWWVPHFVRGIQVC